MLLSMTGFGSGTREIGPKAITVEVKSLNSKFLDLKTRLPQGYRKKEMEIRKIISDIVLRGKVDVNIEVKFLNASQAFVLDEELFKAYFKAFNRLDNELGFGKGTDYLQSILRLPNVVSAGEEVVDADEWKAVIEALKDALKNFTKYRKDEGDSLREDFILRANNIKRLLGEVEPHEEVRIDKLKERFRSQLEDLAGKGNVDENRFEQELIFYMEKLNLSEEKVRLGQHCVYFVEQLAKKDAVKGRKLNFISQEMGREINTLGSKANSAEIQRIVVQMKDELEKIKEQVANAL